MPSEYSPRRNAGEDRQRHPDDRLPERRPQPEADAEKSRAQPDRGTTSRTEGLDPAETPCRKGNGGAADPERVARHEAPLDHAVCSLSAIETINASATQKKMPTF